MLATFTSTKFSLIMIQISLLLLGIFVVNSWATPMKGERQEIYTDTCQASCSTVSNTEEAKECRENFCPDYVNYLLTGYADKYAKPTLASTHQKEVAEFCATWLVYLIEQFGWQYRVRLNLKECICAAGKDCLAK